MRIDAVQWRASKLAGEYLVIYYMYDRQMLEKARETFLTHQEDKPSDILNQLICLKLLALKNTMLKKSAK
jgi:hypothetical protein